MRRGFTLSFDLNSVPFIRLDCESRFHQDIKHNRGDKPQPKMFLVKMQISSGCLRSHFGQNIFWLKCNLKLYDDFLIDSIESTLIKSITTICCYKSGLEQIFF